MTTMPEPSRNPETTPPVVLFRTVEPKEPDPATVDRWEELATALAKQGGHLDGPAVTELHDGTRVRLNNGWLYSTNIASIGGQHGGRNGTFHVPESAPDTTAPSSSRHMGYRLHPTPNHGDLAGNDGDSQPLVVPHRGWNRG